MLELKVYLETSKAFVRNGGMFRLSEVRPWRMWFLKTYLYSQLLLTNSLTKFGNTSTLESYLYRRGSELLGCQRFCWFALLEVKRNENIGANQAYIICPISASTRWYEAYRDCFFQLIQPMRHEFIRDYLACIFFFSTFSSTFLSCHESSKLMLYCSDQQSKLTW